VWTVKASFTTNTMIHQFDCLEIFICNWCKTGSCCPTLSSSWDGLLHELDKLLVLDKILTISNLCSSSHCKANKQVTILYIPDSCLPLR
jgi:hypothetical protein